MGKTRWLALLIVLSFFISAVATQSNYGLSWDEGLGNLFFGERYVYFLTTFSQKYLDFKADLAMHQQHPLNLYLSPFRDYPNEFPAFADTLSAASMHLFSYCLGWMDPVDAWHLFTITLATIFLWVTYRFFAPRLGEEASLLGIMLLAVFPRLWGDMHFNPKDIPQMVFFGFVIMAHLAWYEKPVWRRALFVGLLFGCALGIKANAAFIPVVLFLGILLPGIRADSWKKLLDHVRNNWWQYGLMAIVGLGVYFLTWPYLYADPGRIKDYWSYIISQGSRETAPGWNLQPLLMTVFTMPEVMLVFVIVGFVFVSRQAWIERKPLWCLLLVWLIFPIFRISMPGMHNFDGIRHFIEFLPAAGLVAGYGAVQLANLLAGTRQRLRTVLFGGIVVLVCLNLVQYTVKFYPFEHIYFNRLVGGLPGASRRFGKNEATDYWGTSYRLGMDWLNNNARPDSLVYVPVAEWLAQLTVPLWLRGDLTLVPHDFADSLIDSPNPVYVMFITRPGFYDQVARYCEENLRPLHQIIVDGIPVLKIYYLNSPT